MNPKKISISDFNYPLIDTKIAKYPLEKRDESKLLVYKDGAIEDSHYFDLSKHIPNDSLLIFNDTKVVEARLIFEKTTGGIIEVFCLEPHEQYGDITTAMLQKKQVLWKCLVGGAAKWKNGIKLSKKIVENDSTELTLEVAIVEQRHDYFIIDFNWSNKEITFAEVLHFAGLIPLPPYLNRDAEEEDKKRYQTIYAANDGSVAAPTAGLHFTKNVFESLAAKNIQKQFVTLHVGAGTFKPVKSETIEGHEMHAEFIDVHIATIEKVLLSLNTSIVVVGTTSLRTIETLYWMGVKIIQLDFKVKNVDELIIHQWDAYEMQTNLSSQDALSALVKWMNENKMERLITKTQILIASGYTLRIANGIITNFHQPKSTLLLLIAAIVGDDWKRIYKHAIDNNYRFLSYGDGSLLWNKSL